MVRLRVPITTYKLQFNRGFRFDDARAVVPYLSRLGISDLYASPLFKARKGSSHGYDVTDPSRLNPELGSEQDFDTLVQELRARDMGLLLDIVPNHMAASPENSWWMDILENGRCSPYADFFDIDWNSPGSALQNKVLLPILGSPYNKALGNQELSLILEESGLSVRYHSLKLPLDVKSYNQVISHRLSALEQVVGAAHPTLRRLRQLIGTIERLPSHVSPDPTKSREIYQKRQLIKKELVHIVNSSPEFKAFLSENVALFNGRKGAPHSFDPLDRLLAQQAYRLAFWKTALRKINYRRFFDISDLIGVRVEDPQVFEATHALVFRLISEGKVTGLRIDHVDGLRDPSEYLVRVQRCLTPKAENADGSPSFYIVVEKILAGDENLPPEWPVFGTTGYDFAAILNALFIDSKGIEALDVAYSGFIRRETEFEDVVYEKKKQVLEELFAAEVHTLGHHLARLAQQGWNFPALSSKELSKAIIEVTACLPVYRTYTRDPRVSARDRLYLEQAVEEAQRRASVMEAHALSFLKQVLFLDFPDSLAPDAREGWLRFVMQWQQLTGAVMAKGFEDTALYNYNLLVSLNEVGGDPHSTGLSIDEFHRFNLSRQKRWPCTLNATSTHDTKRGEDVRARINVLSEIPHAWRQCLTQWSQWNRAKKRKVKGRLVPEPNMEVLLYQTLIGAWPLSDKDVPEFKERLKAYVIKAAREAKVFTSWLSPDLKYEEALLAFIDSILESSNQNRFLGDLVQFQKKIAYYGALNSLAQVLLKVTSPGVPDFYQGTELWDLSLVDPDNRRPVDFKKRIGLLDELIRKEAQGQSSLVQEILTSWEDARVKLYVTYKALGVRKACRELFLEGDYIPLQIQGQRQEHVCAFARRNGEEWALIVVPRHLTKLVRVRRLPLGRRVWEDDLLLLTEGIPKRWLHVFTGESVSVSKATKGVPLSIVFRRFPVALLVSTPSNDGF